MSVKTVSEKYIFIVNTTDDNGHTQDYYFEPCGDGGATMWLKSYKETDKVAGFNSCEDAVKWWNTHKEDYKVLFEQFIITKNSLIKIETVHKETDMSRFFNSLCVS